MSWQLQCPPPPLLRVSCIVRRKGLGKPQAVRRFSDADLRCPLTKITIRGSIIGNRKDLAEALEFAAEG